MNLRSFLMERMSVMGEARFKLSSITIEGFYGYPVPEEVVFTGRHAVLIENSNMDQISVVDAIRWALFGSTGNDSTVLKSGHHQSNKCRVVLELSTTGGVWRLERRLRADGVKSYLTVQDPSGEERRKSDLLPHLRLRNPIDGTQMIMATRKVPEVGNTPNLLPFKSILCSHLNLKDEDISLHRLSTIIEAQSNAYEETLSQISEIEDRIKERMEYVELEIVHLLYSSHVDNRSVSTTEGTAEKIKAFAEEFAGIIDISGLMKRSSNELLQQIELWCQELTHTRITSLVESLRTAQARVVDAKRLWDATSAAKQKVAEAQKHISDSRAELGAVLESGMLAELEDQLDFMGSRLIGRLQGTFTETVTSERNAKEKLLVAIQEYKEIEEQLRCAKVQRKEWENRLQSLNWEMRLHSLQAEKSELRWYLTQGLEAARVQCAQMLATVSEAQNLRDTLEHKISNSLNEFLIPAFDSAQDKHEKYNEITLESAKFICDVAQSVPGDESLEFGLLLVDNLPSQSLTSTSHLFFESLKVLSECSQLIVTIRDQADLRGPIEEYFPADEFSWVEVGGSELIESVV